METAVPLNLKQASKLDRSIVTLMAQWHSSAHQKVSVNFERILG